MARFDLTDAEWAVIEPLLPTDVRGKERVDDRRVLNGSSGGCARARPGPTSRRAYGPHTTCGNPFSALAQAWHLGSAFDAVSKAYDGDLQMIDATSVRGSPACRLRPKKDGRSGGMGRFARRPDEQDPRFVGC